MALCRPLRLQVQPVLSSSLSTGSSQVFLKCTPIAPCADPSLMCSLEFGHASPSFLLSVSSRYAWTTSFHGFSRAPSWEPSLLNFVVVPFAGCVTLGKLTSALPVLGAGV